MKRTLSLVSALPIIITAVLAQPNLVVNREKIDLGVLYNGTVTAADIKLTNIGTDTLRIVSIQPSCGCTTVKHPKSALAPGESDVVRVEFNSTGFRGRATKYVNITTNDPSKSYVTITLNAEVKEELQPTTNSSVLWLGTVPLGKSASEKLTFKNLSGATLRVKGIATKNPAITAKFEPEAVKPSGEVTVTFTVRSQKEGYVSEELFLETDSKNQPRVPVRVSFVGVKPS